MDKPPKRQPKWCTFTLARRCTFTPLLTEQAKFDEDTEFSEDDFRSWPFTINDKEAETEGKYSQKVRYSGAETLTFDTEKPPEIRPFLPDLNFDEEDFLEGIEFCDPILMTDTSAELNLSLEDPHRMLPEQVGKWLSDILRSVFQTAALGRFETGGATKCMREDGRSVYTDCNCCYEYIQQRQKQMRPAQLQ
jgi:hypothetical protein